MSSKIENAFIQYLIEFIFELVKLIKIKKNRTTQKCVEAIHLIIKVTGVLVWASKKCCFNTFGFKCIFHIYFHINNLTRPPNSSASAGEIEDNSLCLFT